MSFSFPDKRDPGKFPICAGFDFGLIWIRFHIGPVSNLDSAPIGSARFRQFRHIDLNSIPFVICAKLGSGPLHWGSISFGAICIQFHSGPVGFDPLVGSMRSILFKSPFESIRGTSLWVRLFLGIFGFDWPYSNPAHWRPFVFEWLHLDWMLLSAVICCYCYVPLVCCFFLCVLFLFSMA